jgi:hypothetical protein
MSHAFYLGNSEFSVVDLNAVFSRLPENERAIEQRSGSELNPVV